MKRLCRSCNSSDLELILDLGFSPPSNALLNMSDLSKPEAYFPLRLLFCRNCKLAQTEDFHTSDILFTNSYPYLSSASSSWCQHAEQLVERLVSQLGLGPNSLVTEIASNDGYLLQYLAARNIPCFGIEPTQLAAEISRSKGHDVITSFLTRKLAANITSDKGYSDVVIANNVFAHVPELLEFTKAARDLLTPTGTLVAEIQYFPKLIENLAFDTIYHEHFSYFSLTSIHNLFSRCGLNIFHAEEIPTHGGSLRVFARRFNGAEMINSTIHRMLEEESKLEASRRISSFKDRVSNKRNEIREFFLTIKKRKQPIIGIGAAAKGNTLLNYCGITVEDIPMILDSAKSKHGKFSPGSHIPIRPLEMLAIREFETFLVLPWNLFDEFSKLLSISSDSKDRVLYSLIPNIREIRV